MRAACSRRGRRSTTRFGVAVPHPPCSPPVVAFSIPAARAVLTTRATAGAPRLPRDVPLGPRRYPGPDRHRRGAGAGGDRRPVPCPATPPVTRPPAGARQGHSMVGASAPWTSSPRAACPQTLAPSSPAEAGPSVPGLLQAATSTSSTRRAPIGPGPETGWAGSGSRVGRVWGGRAVSGAARRGRCAGRPGGCGPRGLGWGARGTRRGNIAGTAKVRNYNCGKMMLWSKLSARTEKLKALQRVQEAVWVWVRMCVCVCACVRTRACVCVRACACVRA